MVSLNAVRESNSQITSLFPEGASGLVAVFAGATSGIGESTMKHFAKHVKKPKAYFLGRNENAGSRITTELKTICPEGDFTFIKVDLSLITNVDEVCTQIKSQEAHINVLFLTSGVIGLEKKGCSHTAAFWGTSLTAYLDTSEGLEKIAAISLYSRIRLMQNFLPHLQQASPALARIVNVFSGAKGGACYENDLAGRTLSPLKHRTATATMTTMAMEHLAVQAPEVSFLHMFPGFVRTANQDQPGMLFALIRGIMYVFGRWICVSLEESGERNLFHCTSAKYPPKVYRSLEDDPASNHAVVAGVPLSNGTPVAEASEGSQGKGIYLINWDGEIMPENPLFAEYRATGMKEKIWRHIEEEFKRIVNV